MPPNGLVLYTGTILTDEGKEKKVNIDFEPFKTINTSLYLCDNKFHTEALSELLESENKYGFIVMDGNGSLFGTLSGNTREILHKFSVDLPKKHGRGGQSALRFARLRMEKRHNYVRKVRAPRGRCGAHCTRGTERGVLASSRAGRGDGGAVLHYERQGAPPPRAQDSLGSPRACADARVRGAAERGGHHPCGVGGLQDGAQPV